MPAHAFHHLDVFTSTPLAGNPLAVFPDADGISARTMQALARELNLSETTFVTPSATADHKVRFFTPGTELPLAGHPTIGTWWLLAELGRVKGPRDGELRVTQETGAGVLPVDITFASGKPQRVVMTQTSPQFGQSLPVSQRLVEALGGDGRTLAPEPMPQLVSTGVPLITVPIASLAELRRLPSGGSGATLAKLLREFGADLAMCYSLETELPGSTVHCRAFAPGIGVPEDPATGIAAGALGSYLVWHGLVRPHDGVAGVTVEQGIEIGRPSIIHVEISVGNGGEITQVRVGGEAVTVIRGEVRL